MRKLVKALQVKFQEERRELVQQQRKVAAKLELVLVTDKSAESVEDLNHRSVFNSKVSDMSKKIEKIESI